jgi:hypothetical protein
MAFALTYQYTNKTILFTTDNLESSLHTRVYGQTRIIFFISKTYIYSTYYTYGVVICMFDFFSWNRSGIYFEV